MSTIVTYEPDNSLKKGYLSIFGEIFREFQANRWLTFQLFKRDFLSIYKQSFIGIFWVFIIPLVGLATFMILKSSGVFNVGEIDIPYPLYDRLEVITLSGYKPGILATVFNRTGSMLEFPE